MRKDTQKGWVHYTPGCRGRLSAEISEAAAYVESPGDLRCREL